MTEIGRPTGESPLTRAPVIVLGATSLVGGFLLPRLAAAGVDTIAVSRVGQPSKPGTRWVESDLQSLDLPPDVESRLAFSLSPIWLLPGAIPALSQAGVARIVAFSSTSRFTKASSSIASERAVVRLLIDGENRTQSDCEQRGIAWTILRPTVIYAEGRDRSITRLANLVRRTRLLPLAGGGLGRRQPVHADDLAAGALAAALSPATMNRAYEVPGGETLTYRLMAERIFEGMGRRPRIVRIPPPLWRLGMSLTSKWMRGLTTEMGTRMADDLVFDPAPAERDFAWHPRDFRPQFDTARTGRWV